LAPEFNVATVIIDILEDLGYKRLRPTGWDEILGHKEFEVHPTFVKFRTSYGSTGHKRFCILRIRGQEVHIHGSEITCLFINLADPGSLDRLRGAIASAEEPDGNTGKS
jgi:hypothetical protein